jgi:peptide/nickel transport system substrate-binding protein
MYQRFLKASRLLTLAIGVAAASLSVTSVHAVDFKWAAQNDILTLDPHSQNHATTNNIVGHAYEGLVRYDKNYKIEPSLATSWTNVSPTVMRFNLRKNVKFHDGTPFTADDVVFFI